MTDSKAVATRDDFAIMTTPVDDVAEIIALNVGDEALGINDLDRIKIPSGGGLNWTIPTLDGEKSTDEFDGIIVHAQDVRAYWETSLDEGGGGNPPDCASPDGKTGYGNPGGLCRTCPMAEFGSAEKGEGQACKQMKRIYVVPKGSILPILVTAPPTSLQAVKRYMLRLAGHSTPYYGVVTRFTLTKEKNARNIEYARLNLSSVEVLEDGDRAKVKQYAERIRPFLEQQPIGADDYDSEPVEVIDDDDGEA